MRDWLDAYSPWLFIFGLPVICFVIAMLTGCELITPDCRGAVSAAWVEGYDEALEDCPERSTCYGKAYYHGHGDACNEPKVECNILRYR